MVDDIGRKKIKIEVEIPDCFVYNEKNKSWEHTRDYMLRIGGEVGDGSPCESVIVGYVCKECGKYSIDKEGEGDRFHEHIIPLTYPGFVENIFKKMKEELDKDQSQDLE